MALAKIFMQIIFIAVAIIAANNKEIKLMRDVLNQILKAANDAN